MVRRSSNGFTMIEIVIVIIMVGIIGSMAATMLYHGSEIFVKETRRQSFVSEARSAFWNTMRETHGQRSPTNFVFSGQNNIFLVNSIDEQKEFQIQSPNSFNYRMGGAGNYNLLSSYLSFDRSGGFKYYDNSFNIISPSSAGLTEDQAELVHLSRLELTFINEEDIISLSSFIYPYNFKFGQKMSYHE